MALASAAGPTDVPLIDETIGENLEAMVARFPERDALVVPHQGVRYTYAEFNDAVDTVARGLLAGRLNVGDRIGIWSPNNAEWVLVQYATAKIGAILVNINPAYRTSELEYALNQSGCRSLISAHTHLISDYVAMIDEVRPRVTALERVIYLESEDWQDLIEAAATVPMDALREVSASLSADQPINIQYTSGTTGFPKGATLSHTNILNNGFFTGEACGYDETDRVCIPVPFYHCFGMVMGNIACTTHGSTIVVPGAAFDPEAVLETVESEGCTSLYGVPTMFIGVLGHENFDDYDLTTLRTGIMAGSPCPAEVMKRVISDMHMDKVTIAYGMTETSPVSTQTGGDDDIERRVLTVGRVHPHVEIKIVNPESDRTVERGERGEFCTRGYSVMIGYWNESERTAEVIDAEGWMHTGDLATMDDEGYVKIVGRIKDMIIRGGENVYPREIEEFLYTHPDIVDAQVIGVPDQKFGEQVMAWVTLKPGATLTEEDVKEYCRGRIAHYKVPAYVAFVDEFPMTVTGKIQKFKLREMAVEELGLEEATSAGA
ncbi:MAG: AMP-binding protein [Actinomycetota bacterium]|nr:AMP-binding protein [Actinomycetota bacterium]